MILPYVFVAAVVVLGVGLWIWPTLFSNEAITPSDVRALGNQVLGGAVVAAAILIAERAINARYEEEQANKAAIRKVLKACTRKAVTTQMNAQTNYPAMFKGITECRISVQQILPEIRVENQQLIGADIRTELILIEEREANFDENYEDNIREIDRAKRSILQHLTELSNNAGVPYPLPRTLTEEWFSDAEGANAPSEGPESTDTGR